MPHTDGPAYHPHVMTITLGPQGGQFVLSRRLPSHKIGEEAASDSLELFLEVGSILIFSESAYSDYLHEIKPIEGDRRVSLTLRTSIGNK